MTKSNESGSEPETEEPIKTPQKTPKKGSKKITEYEKQRLKRIEENKERMKAMGLQKMANLVMASSPISKNKGKKKVGLKDDQYATACAFLEHIKGSLINGTDAVLAMPQTKVYTSKKYSKLSDNAGYVDDDEALMKAIALSLKDSPGFLDTANKTPPQSSDANANSGVKSRVQMSEDELILHFFQFDGKGGINLRDLRRVAASHDFTWKDEEMEHMIQFFDSNEDGKLSLEDFTKIVERCNMRQGPENTEPASILVLAIKPLVIVDMRSEDILKYPIKMQIKAENYKWHESPSTQFCPMESWVPHTETLPWHFNGLAEAEPRMVFFWLMNTNGRLCSFDATLLALCYPGVRDDVADNATYCASVEDIAVQYCFFDILLTSLSPRNCIPPEVLLRVSMHSACSTSENALEKPLDIRKLDNSSYQALGACFKPYKAFLKR
ncbi:centrin-2-like isoform X1 [Tanacetum coccineum]